MASVLPSFYLSNTNINCFIYLFTFDFAVLLPCAAAGSWSGAPADNISYVSI
jgi:hypothetical protein